MVGSLFTSIDFVGSCTSQQDTNPGLCRLRKFSVSVCLRQYTSNNWGVLSQYGRCNRMLIVQLRRVRQFRLPHDGRVASWPVMHLIPTLADAE